jgi:hypothetical protein
MLVGIPHVLKKSNACAADLCWTSASPLLPESNTAEPTSRRVLCKCLAVRTVRFRADLGETPNIRMPGYRADTKDRSIVLIAALLLDQPELI